MADEEGQRPRQILSMIFLSDEEDQSNKSYEFYLDFFKNVKGKERKSMVAEILDRFNIVAKKDLFPEQLSGGQQQLVGVARAVISKPRLLLADEPTGNLHTKQGDQIMELFKELNDEGVTIIQVTHSERNASFGTRIIELVDGNIRRDEQIREPSNQADTPKGMPNGK